MLQSHIVEAHKVEMMVLPLSNWEKRVWREAQGTLPSEDRAWYMEEFITDRLA
jgi:hypothetical protein